MIICFAFTVRLDHQLDQLVLLRDQYHRLVLEKINRVVSNAGLKWSLRGGSVIGPARYGSWDFVSKNTVNIVNFDLDTAVYLVVPWL